MLSLGQTTDLLRLLGDATRVRLLALLEREELSVAELTRITRLTQSRVSTHLGKLRDAGLVRDRRAGAFAYYSVVTDMPAEARRAWTVVRDTARDPLLEQDARRLREGLPWADSVAGQMERHYSPGRTWQATLRGLVGLLDLGRVLDVASGDCALAELVAPHARSVTCLDLSPRVLAAGRRRLADAGLAHVGFCQADMHALPFDTGSFDHVLMMACLCYAAEPARALAEAARVLAPGGRLIGVTLRSHGHLEHSERYDHIHPGYEPEALGAMLEGAGLAVDRCAVTARERRVPHFEVVTLHARKPPAR
ncbi:MAG: metalloregulator ArsR/SmtB family transcription factor [Planctomycetota bacterium]|jgi:ArsR family transcriptional regulator